MPKKSFFTVEIIQKIPQVPSSGPPARISHLLGVEGRGDGEGDPGKDEDQPDQEEAHHSAGRRHVDDKDDDEDEDDEDKDDEVVLRWDF